MNYIFIIAYNKNNYQSGDNMAFSSEKKERIQPSKGGNIQNVNFAHNEFQSQKSTMIENKKQELNFNEWNDINFNKLGTPKEKEGKVFRN
jgi:hypothetical protein